MRAALARGGVAVVVVPGEVFLADAPSPPRSGPDPGSPSRSSVRTKQSLATRRARC